MLDNIHTDKQTNGPKNGTNTYGTKSGFRKPMPDIAKETRPEILGAIDWVGMSSIEVPARIRNSSGEEFVTPAKVDAFVSLDDEKAKGIHMSRPFLLIQEMFADAPLDFSLLSQLLQKFIQSQEGISGSSQVRVQFEYMTRRAALKSPTSGWRSYPVEMIAQCHKDQVKLILDTKVLYSSTCPCSAALARQLIQEKFLKDFDDKTISRDAVSRWLSSTDGIVATPHSQRSQAHVKISLDEKAEQEPGSDIENLVNLVESAVKTAVQTSVKREDEQEFARLNGQNLMFVEDAIRKIRGELDQCSSYNDYWIHVDHRESLHPHDAVAIAVKGVKDGFQAKC